MDFSWQPTEISIDEVTQIWKLEVEDKQVDCRIVTCIDSADWWRVNRIWVLVLVRIIL